LCLPRELGCLILQKIKVIYHSTLLKSHNLKNVFLFHCLGPFFNSIQLKSTQWNILVLLHYVFHHYGHVIAIALWRPTLFGDLPPPEKNLLLNLSSSHPIIALHQNQALPAKKKKIEHGVKKHEIFHHRNYLCVKYQGCTHDMINDF
jgi:hypothetical protein